MLKILINDLLSSKTEYPDMNQLNSGKYRHRNKTVPEPLGHRLSQFVSH